MRAGERPYGFAAVLVPAAAAGAAWDWSGLPLGWVMGAALVSGVAALSGADARPPAALNAVALATVGCSVGLAVTPEVAAEMARWTPVMLFAAVAGVALAAALAPLLARTGRMALSTAFFSLLPGGVIEMASIGDRFGADRVAIASLHAMRVALVVSLMPLALFAAFPASGAPDFDAPRLEPAYAAAALLAALLGGWAGRRVGMPAAWLLGAVCLTAAAAASGVFEGRLPEPLLAAAQAVVGISLGARFRRDSMVGVPRALAAGLPVLLVVMAAMATLAGVASQAMPQSFATLALCFAIGGMAEMVLTARALGEGVALVAAFQAVRGVVVNASAALVWRLLSKRYS